LGELRGEVGRWMGKRGVREGDQGREVEEGLECRSWE